MPGRSPYRRSPPPPPLISRHSPGRSRLRSPGRHQLEMASSSRGRREFRPTARRSRSPPNRRSFSPPMKRKHSPVTEREMPRRSKISKSPVGSHGGSRGAPELRYNPPAVEPEPRSVRNVASPERFRDREYEEDREGGAPKFRGPEGSVDFDINDLKKFTIEIVRKPTSSLGDSSINRNIINPDDIAPVRRPDEGARPLFLRAEAGCSKEKSRSDDYQRIVAINNSRGSGRDRERSQERGPPRYSPGPSHYEDNRRPYYNERERGHSPFKNRHRSPPRNDFSEMRDKRERKSGFKEDFKQDYFDGRKKEGRFPPERRLSYERDSDLRSRINEKRNEPHTHPRMEEREREIRYEGERHGRPHHSPPPREHRRPVSPEGYDRREGWEEREKDGRREPRQHPHFHPEEPRRPPAPHKTDYEPNKFYNKFEEKEFNSPPVRGGRGLPLRRGMNPIMRGRGVSRGLNRGFRRGNWQPPRFFPPY